MVKEKVMFRCSECGSTNLIKAGKRWRRIDHSQPKRAIFQQWRCKNCGKTQVPDGSLPIDDNNGGK